jgi:hypothetical protein
LASVLYGDREFWFSDREQAGEQTQPDSSPHTVTRDGLAVADDSTARVFEPGEVLVSAFAKRDFFWLVETRSVTADGGADVVTV